MRFREPIVALRRNDGAVAEKFLQGGKRNTPLQPPTREGVPKLVNMEPLDPSPREINQGERYTFITAPPPHGSP